jgi:hypothetical protein
MGNILFLDDRVPFIAVFALSGPFAGSGATGLADEYFSLLCHL